MSRGMLAFVVAMLWVGSFAPADSSGAMPATTSPATSPTTRGTGATVKLFTIDPSPTRITAHMKNEPADAIFNRLSHLASARIVPEGNAFDDRSLQGAGFSVDWDKTTFWDALLEACDATGLRVRESHFTSGPARLFVLHSDSHAPVFVDGAVLLRAVRISRRASISYDHPQATGDVIELLLEVNPEPRLSRWTRFENPLIEKAMDDAGHELQTSPRPDAPLRPGYGFPVSVLLRYPAHAGKKIALLRGSIPLQVPRLWATVLFDRPRDHAGEAVSLGKNQLVLDDAGKDDHGRERVTLSLKRGEGVNDEQWRWVAEGLSPGEMGVMLTSPHSVRRPNATQGHLDAQEAQERLFFPESAGDEAPTQLRIDVPVEFAPVNARFEFKDLPMP